MKNIILFISSLLIYNLSPAQIEQKLNVDLEKFNIICKLDTSKWRAVKLIEYNEQNPSSLEFLKDPSLNFYNGYILKKSTILEPPTIMIQSMNVPEEVNIDVLKKQADTVISNNSYLIKKVNELKMKGSLSTTFIERFLNSKNYFDKELNAFIVQMKVPGINNEVNIIHSANYIHNGQMVSIKMIYLESSQFEYFQEFNKLIKSLKIK